MTGHVSASRPEKWTAGVDWFRYRLDRPAAVREAREKIDVLQLRDAMAASKLKSWTFMGYSGFASDSIRWGTREDRLLWESSGETAASTQAFMGSSGGRALRIDLQVTVQFPSSQPRLGTYLTRCSPVTTLTRRQLQTRRSQTSATDGLWLGTVGRRISPSYIRVYDKGVESKLAPAGIMWRVELEAKRNHAERLCQDHGTSLQNPKFCANYVASSLTHLGSRWPWPELVGSPIDIRLGKKESTTAGALAMWLSETVAPTMPRLLTVFTVAEVLAMLQLSAVAAPIGKANA